MGSRWWRRFVPYPKKRVIQRWFPPFEIRKSVALTIRSGATVVFDIGANTGQYAQRLRAAGYKGRIVSFEPLPDAHSTLEQTAAKDDKWEVPAPVAVGASSGILTLHQYADSSLSSALQPVGHTAGTQSFAPVASIDVPVMPLDDLAAQHLRPGDKVFLKIDVQGLEPEVIEGGGKTLSQAVGAQIELSLTQIYEGETGYLEILARLEQYGLRVVYFFPVVFKRRMVPEHQMDALLLRR